MVPENGQLGLPEFDYNFTAIVITIAKCSDHGIHIFLVVTIPYKANRRP